MTNRINSIDIAKGLAIISVVQGHINGHNFINSFIFLIHMVFFFIVSGLFINEEKYILLNDFRKFVTTRFKKLCVPFILFNVIFTLLHNFFIKINLYTNSESFFTNNSNIHLSCGLQHIYTTKILIIKTFWALLMARTEPLLGVTWFLPVLFFSSCIIVAIIIITKRFKTNGFIYTVLGIACIGELGYYCYLHNIDIYGIGRILSCVIPIYIGTLFHKHLSKLLNFSFKELVVSFLLLLSLNIVLKNKILLINNFYYDPLLLSILTILSLMFFISLANIMEKYKFSAIFLYIGKNTLPILLLHPLSYKFVTLLQIVIYKEPLIRLASFQTYYTNGLWGICYLIAGVVIPLLLNELYQKVKQGIIK